MAGEAGDTYALVKIGRIHENGNGVPQDYTEAAKWYRKAAELANATVNTTCGRLLSAGQGVAQDDTRREMVSQAAEVGHANGSERLGYMYLNGRGVPQDDAEALRWFRVSAEQGFATAQSNLGWMYETDRGVAQDNSEALKWFSSACVAKYEKACEMRTALETRLSQSDVVPERGLVEEHIEDEIVPDSEWTREELKLFNRHIIHRRRGLVKEVSDGCLLEVHHAHDLQQIMSGKARYEWSGKCATGQDGQKWATGAGTLVAKVDNEIRWFWDVRPDGNVRISRRESDGLPAIRFVVPEVTISATKCELERGRIQAPSVNASVERQVEIAQVPLSACDGCCGDQG